MNGMSRKEAWVLDILIV